MEKLISIAPLPKVGVKVHSHADTMGDTLERITLFLAPQFVLDCPSKKLQHELLPWLKAYAQGKWSQFPLPPYTKTPFTEKAARFLQAVPSGQVISYKELAAAIGHPGAARAIGSFCSGNLFPLFMPCHRVIPSTGGTGTFTPDPRIKERLLDFEGVTPL